MTMPAAKHLDPLLGIDIHIIQPPGPVPPVPIPHPHIGVVLDPFDYVPYIGGTVTVGGLKRAQAGTAGLSVPHFPIGGVFIKPPANESEIFMGSSTVAVDGDAFSYLALPVLSCQDIGIPAPGRPKGSPPKSLVLPTTVVLSIPLGVLVGGAPTISLMALGMRFGMAALGKALKKLKALAKGSKRMKALSRRVHRWAKKTMNRLGIPPSVQNRVHRAICSVTGHPVDLATGKVFSEALDFVLEGPITLVWQRVWYSCSSHVGALGHGWHHPFDMRLWAEGEGVLVRMDDGRYVPFAAPGEQGSFNQDEGLTLWPIADAAGRAGYRLERFDGVAWVFEAARALRVEGAVVHDHVLARIEDRCGNAIELVRSHQGSLEHILDSTGRRLDLDYEQGHDHDQRRIVAVWGPDPREPGARLALVRYVYDAAGELIEAHDPEGGVTRYDYREHLLVRETDRCAMAWHFEWSGVHPEARCTRTWGDGGLLARALRYEPGLTVWVDGRGVEQRVEHDGAGKVLRQFDGAGRVASVEYDEDGFPLVRTEADGRVTRWTYDERKRTIAILEPGDLITTFAYDERNCLVEVGYPDGSKRLREYDARGCLIGELEPDGTRWRYEVDARGLRTRDLGPQGVVLEQRWSARGELVGFASDAGEVAYELDALGRVRRELHGHAREVVYERDRLGRVLAVIDSSGEVERHTLDAEGRVLAIHDALGLVQRIDRDLAGRERAIHDGEGRTLRCEWDGENNLVALIDARGRTHEFGHDRVGELVRERDVIGRVTEYQRDAGGRVTRQVEIDRAGVARWHAYGYDPRGRLATIERSDGHARSVVWDALDRVTAIVDGELSIQRSYDRRGNLVAESIGELELRSEWRDDRLRARVYPEGQRLELDWTAAGELECLRSEAGELARWRYEGGRELARESPGVIARREWTPQRRLARQWLEPRDDRPDPGWQREYDYDAARHTLACHDAQGSTRLQVGRNGELWRAQRDGSDALFELPRDAAGHLAGTPAADERALDERGVVVRANVYRWDAAGRLVEKRRRDGSRRVRLTWNDANQLVEAELEREGQPHARVALRYDGLGRLVRERIERASGERVELDWIYDGVALAGERRREWASADASEPTLRMRDFLLRPDDLAPLAILEPDASPLLIECDQASAARAAVDGEGSLAWSLELDVLGGAGEAAPDQRERVPFRFLGQREDVELGLHYNYFRWYDPELGAYLSPDPIGQRGGPLAWNYVASPFDASDPFGLFHHNDPGHYVYGLYDPPNPPAPGQKPYYVGITNDPKVRAGQHMDSGRLSGGSHMQTLDGPVKYGDARGFEQAYIEHHGTKTGTIGAPMGSRAAPLSGNARGNRVNSFDVNSPTRAKVRQDAFNDARTRKLDSLKPPCK